MIPMEPAMKPASTPDSGTSAVEGSAKNPIQNMDTYNPQMIKE